MTDSPRTPLATTESSDAHLSHLAQLHRMSRTAGLGSSDYTAVNTAAVIAILIGVASGLALVSPIFLLLPAVGLIIAIMAIVQIRASGGTQTGLTLAIVGLLLCAGFAGATGLQLIKQEAVRKQDIVELGDLLDRFGKSLAAAKYADAYQLTDARFREQVPQNKFETFFTELTASPAVGPILGVRSNGIFRIEADQEADIRQAVGIGMLDTKNLPDNAARGSFRYRHTDNGWLIMALPEWFAPGVKRSEPSSETGLNAPDDTLAPTGPAGPRMNP